MSEKDKEKSSDSRDTNMGVFHLWNKKKSETINEVLSPKKRNEFWEELSKRAFTVKAWTTADSRLPFCLALIFRLPLFYFSVPAARTRMSAWPFAFLLLFCAVEFSAWLLAPKSRDFFTTRKSAFQTSNQVSREEVSWGILEELLA